MGFSRNKDFCLGHVFPDLKSDYENNDVRHIYAKKFFCKTSFSVLTTRHEIGNMVAVSFSMEICKDDSSVLNRSMHDKLEKAETHGHLDSITHVKVPTVFKTSQFSSYSF